MGQDDGSSPWLSPNAYLSMAQQMQAMADRAISAETEAEFRRLAVLYEKLASHMSRGTHPQADAPPLAPYKGISRIPLQETYFRYTAEVVATHAPRAAGIYALWNKEFWIYIGESADIQGRLLHHHAHNNERIAQMHPTSFGFELIDDPVERVARHAALIRDLMPIC